MNLRAVFLALAIGLLVVSALLLARAFLFPTEPTVQPQVAAPAAPPSPVSKVLVANVDIPPGSFLKDEMLRWQSWPNDAVDPGFFLEGKTDPKSLMASGAVARRPISAGTPITESQLVRPGDRGFLAAVLKPGMRAISIAVNEVSGLAGLVYPGDRVDVMLVHPMLQKQIAGNVSSGKAVEVPNSKGQETKVSETILENVRILAIDQMLGHPDGQAGPAARTLTIEVTPKQAEMMAVAVQLGSLTLALRSLANLPESSSAITNLLEIPEPDRGTTFTLDSDVSRATPPPEAPRPTPVLRAGPVQRTIEVNRGGKVEQAVVN